MADQTCYSINSQRVIHETLDGEVLVIDSENGHYHSIAGIGAAIWGMLATPQSGSSIADRISTICEVVPQTIRADIDAFVARLLAAHLIVVAETSAAATIPSASPGLEYSRPDLRSHTDLEDLLLFDPIHEVGQGGWPERKI